jgi:DNA modification methylase
MEIRKKPIEKLNPAAYNPRKDLQPGDPEYKKLKRSMQEFGYVEPIVWNKRTGNIVGGHQRYKVLLDMGMREVDCVVVDLDEATEKALNLALNKIQGDWDNLKLKDLLQELDTGEFDIELTGFGMDEIEDLMTQFHVPGEIVEDEAPEPPEEPITKPGDLWLLGRHRLLCGDSTNEKHVNTLFNSQCPDIIITDPPYCSGGFQEAGKRSGSIGTRGNVMIANDTLSTRGYQSLIKNTFATCPGVGVVYVFTDWRMWINLFDVVEAAGYGVRNMIVWDKGTPGMGSGWRMQHELIMVGIKVKSPFNPKKAQGNVIQMKRTGNINHPTEKPVNLISKIMDVTALAKSIYDPFGGSGTTLIACEQLNRTCYMMELDPIYCDVIVQRYINLKGHDGDVYLERDGNKIAFSNV